LGLLGSSLGPVRVSPVRVYFRFVFLFLAGRVIGLLGRLGDGPTEALNENLCGGISLRESLMVGVNVYDVIGWELYGNDWSINGLSGL
jgi:hypothetical protein